MSASLVIVENRVLGQLSIYAVKNGLINIDLGAPQFVPTTSNDLDCFSIPVLRQFCIDVNEDTMMKKPTKAKMCDYVFEKWEMLVQKHCEKRGFVKVSLPALPEVSSSSAGYVAKDGAYDPNDNQVDVEANASEDEQTPNFTLVLKGDILPHHHLVQCKRNSQIFEVKQSLMKVMMAMSDKDDKDFNIDDDQDLMALASTMEMWDEDEKQKLDDFSTIGEHFNHNAYGGVLKVKHQSNPENLPEMMLMFLNTGCYRLAEKRWHYL